MLLKKKKKILHLGFADNRNEELRAKLEDTIYEYNKQAKMTYTAVIGVLQMLSIDLYEESK